MQHWAKIQYTEPDCYNVDNNDFVTTWDTGYASILTNLTAITRSELGNDSYTAVAEILKAWTFLLLTNLYGDIPYTEYATTTTPAYDSQETVLRGLLADLSSAATLLSQSREGISGDLVYGGDLTKWLKLANSLRLRIALELADRDEATAREIIAAAYSNRQNLISGNDDNFSFRFTASPQWNPWASAFSARDDQRVSKTLVDKLTELGDPRLPVFAQLPQDTSVDHYAGAGNGLSADAANNQGFYKVSRPGTAFLADDAPAVFFTYAEVLFSFAEAAARGFINADAAALYSQAVSASLKQYGADEEEIREYLQKDGVKYDAARWYESIGWQKWIAFYGQGPDAFTDWRRLGYPTLTPGPNTVLDPGETPRRFFYPSTEQSLNSVSYKVAVSRQGVDLITTRLWFDVENKGR